MFPGSRFLCTVCRLLLQKFFQSLSRQPAARHKQQRHPQKSKQKQHILPCDRMGECAVFVCSFGGAAAACADRKSTRLNSSHVSISYAVFCLKKKTESN